MDFSSLEPLTEQLAHPPRFTDHTLTVGQTSSHKPKDLLAGFEQSFASLDTSPQAIALVVATSGSTGKPKKTLLSSGALAASAHATETFTETSNAQWLLALPAHYIAGAQVLARSVLAGTTPVIIRSVLTGGHFSTDDFLHSAEQLTGAHRMVSLVPTQLTRLMEACETRPELLAALRSFRAVLLGGAPAHTALLDRARREGITVLHTYGSAETAGGCVYNGQPLPNVRVEIEENTGSDTGRIWLSGPQLASGYLDSPEQTAKHFLSDTEGNRWYRTDDLGLYQNSRLTVTGRVDDLIISGGLKISPAPITAKLEEHPGVREAFVCGLDSLRWGSSVAAAINMAAHTDPAHLEQDLRPLIQELEAAQRPKTILYLREFPRLSTGKLDRQKLKELLASHAPEN